MKISLLILTLTLLTQPAFGEPIQKTKSLEWRSVLVKKKAYEYKKWSKDLEKYIEQCEARHEQSCYPIPIVLSKDQLIKLNQIREDCEEMTGGKCTPQIQMMPVEGDVQKNNIT